MERKRYILRCRLSVDCFVEPKISKESVQCNAERVVLVIAVLGSCGWARGTISSDASETCTSMLGAAAIVMLSKSLKTRRARAVSRHELCSYFMLIQFIGLMERGIQNDRCAKNLRGIPHHNKTGPLATLSL